MVESGGGEMWWRVGEVRCGGEERGQVRCGGEERGR